MLHQLNVYWNGNVLTINHMLHQLNVYWNGNVLAINHMLHQLNVYWNGNVLAINCDKTKCMTFNKCGQLIRGRNIGKENLE